MSADITEDDHFKDAVKSLYKARIYHWLGAPHLAERQSKSVLENMIAYCSTNGIEYKTPSSMTRELTFKELDNLIVPEEVFHNESIGEIPVREHFSFNEAIAKSLLQISDKYGKVAKNLIETFGLDKDALHQISNSLIYTVTQLDEDKYEFRAFCESADTFDVGNYISNIMRFIHRGKNGEESITILDGQDKENTSPDTSMRIFYENSLIELTVSSEGTCLGEITINQKLNVQTIIHDVLAELFRGRY